MGLWVCEWLCVVVLCLNRSVVCILSVILFPPALQAVRMAIRTAIDLFLREKKRREDSGDVPANMSDYDPVPFVLEEHFQLCVWIFSPSFPPCFVQRVFFLLPLC